MFADPMVAFVNLQRCRGEEAHHRRTSRNRRCRDWVDYSAKEPTPVSQAAKLKPDRSSRSQFLCHGKSPGRDSDDRLPKR